MVLNASPWTQADKDQWFKEQTIKRSYLNEVVSKIKELQSNFEVIQYGSLSINRALYPLFMIQSKKFDSSKKTILITGGVHGYETSGVHGALSFMKNEAHLYSHQFNFLCAPCISPWAYETINRWNTKAIDPNRSFVENSEAEECTLFLNAVAQHQNSIYAHFDLHETTDTDNTVFRPALEKRDGKIQEFSEIPDGFYTVGDSHNPRPDFQKAVIDSVRKITHIADADQDGKIIGETIQQPGVVNYPVKSLFLCAGFSNAQYTTTTEVYPDSPKLTDEICIDAQVAAIKGGLDYLKALQQKPFQ